MADDVHIVNPVIKDTDAEGAELLKMAQAADQATTADDEVSSTDDLAQRAASADKGEVAQPEVKPDSPDASAEPTRDELGRFTKADGTKSEPNEPAEKPAADVKPTETKPDSKYEKARKDEERLARNRREFEEEKTREREQLRREREEFERQRNAPSQTTTGQYSSKDFEAAAAEFEKEAAEAMRQGDPDEAAEKRDLALKAHRAAGAEREKEGQVAERGRLETFQKTWTENMNSHMREVAELRDAESPISKEVMKLLAEEKIFNFLPDGFAQAHRIAKLRLEAAEASGLRDENKKLREEVEKFKKLTALDGGGPIGYTPAKDFDKMSLEEQGSYIQRAAERADQAA